MGRDFSGTAGFVGFGAVPENFDMALNTFFR